MARILGPYHCQCALKPASKTETASYTWQNLLKKIDHEGNLKTQCLLLNKHALEKDIQQISADSRKTRWRVERYVKGKHAKENALEQQEQTKGKGRRENENKGENVQIFVP